MRSHLSELDAAMESYLGKMAAESLETRTRQAENVRIHYQSPAAGLLLPAGQAAASGAFIGLAVLVIAWLAEWPKPWAWGLITWLTIQAVMWCWLLWEWRRIVIYRLEEMTRRDLDGDYQVGPPAQTIRIELTENNGQTGRFIELPGGAENLAEMARGVLAGASLSESSWTGKGKPFSRGVFAEVKNELIRRGLATWNSPGTTARGISLNAAGRAVFRKLADSPTLFDEPPPDLE